MNQKVPRRHLTEFGADNTQSMSQKRARSSTGSSGAAKKKPAIQRQGAMVGQPAFKSLARQQNTVRSGPEKKNLDVDDTLTTGTNINIPAGASTWVIGATQLLNGMAQGTTAITRLGRKVQGKKINISYTVALQATSIGGGQVKIRVVYDKQSNGAAFAILDYLSIDGFDSANNLDNSDRFITLANHLTEPISVQNNFSACGKLNIPIDLETMYTGANGVVANILTGSIYLICSQDGQIGTAGPKLGFYSRYRFVDN